jgi:hypothetical protein
MSVPGGKSMLRKEETEDWAHNAKKTHHQLFSELDVLLRALDRFFDMESLTFSNEDLTNKNFYEELVTARDAILRVLGILEVVIPESRKNAYWFQKFAETKLLTTRKRDDFRETLYRQDTLERGLYLLYDSFINLKGIISDLIRTGSISYMGFMNIGHMIGKEIRENRYFNPFSKAVNPEFDTISHPKVSEVVKSIERPEVKKQISVIYVYLFRFSRFLRHVDIETPRPVSLNASLIVLILMKSEVAVFRAYIEKELRKIGDPELQMILKAIAYQFSMESRRVFHQEMRDILRKKASPHFRGKIENCHGILKNLTEQSIVQLTQYFRPEIPGEEIFASFVTKLQQSIRLREDIFMLHRFISILEERAGNDPARVRAFESLRNYMLYFESFTFRLLRHDDYEEFAMFFNEINTAKGEAVAGAEFPKLLERIRHFKIYLETTLRHIGNRSELNDKDIDMERVENLIRQYL